MISLKDILPKFPLFSSLRKESIEELSRISVLREFKKGQVIYKEQDSPDNLYMVLSGRVKTYTQASLKEKRILEYLYKGTCFGIISLLTDEPHSVTAEAANDSFIIQISKDKFREFLEKNPHLALELSKILSRRVKKRANKDKNIFESIIISVYSPKENTGKTTYSLVLAKALTLEAKKKVIVIEFKSKDRVFSLASSDKILEIRKFNEANLDRFLVKIQGFDYIGAHYQSNSSEASREISLFLSFLTQFYNFIILDFPYSQGPLEALCLIQSDFIHLLLPKQLNYSREITKTINFLEDAYKIKKDQLKIILKEINIASSLLRGKIFSKKREEFYKVKESYKIFATLPVSPEKAYLETMKSYPNTSYTKVLRRIAREISSVRIGLALGSGAAFGLAHIGVLKVLEENNLDIDIVSGSSMGSVIAALWGLGKNWKQIRDLAYKFKNFPIFSFLDIGFSGKAFLKGRYLKKVLKELFGNKTFYRLKRPVLIVSFDFKKRKPYVLSGGNFLIYQAVLASCAMPGIFEPVKTKDDLLLDGGVLNPLPVGCLIEEGVKKIISVNVTPSKEEVKKMYKDAKDKKKFNIFDFIFGSIEAMQQEFIQQALPLSDVVIHPEFGDSLWTDFKKVDYFIEKGEKEALKYVDRIREL